MYGSSMDGIFFDDGYNQCGTGNQFPAIYEAINRYEKLRHRGAMTVLNPGAVVPQCYENSADVLLTFQGSYATYESSAYQALDWHGNFCAHWLIENSTLLVYAGTGIGQWSWTPVAYIPPTVNGYNYSWTVPVSDIGDAVDYIDMQGEGYGPLTNVISGVEQ
jgi:hypothetical protein